MHDRKQLDDPSSPQVGGNDVTVDRDPVEFLASEFLDRRRDGENPTIEEYKKGYPDLADRIGELFPTIVSLEQFKLKAATTGSGRASLGGMHLERLGDFRIIREIGRGGMGIVFEAEQESLGRRVAVKVLPRQSILDSKHLKRFQREAQTAAQLHHTNIVPVFGVGEQDGFHYLVMQYIRGVGLDEVLLLGHAPAITPAASSHPASVQDETTGRVHLAELNEIARLVYSGKYVRNETEIIARNTSNSSGIQVEVSADVSTTPSGEVTCVEQLPSGGERPPGTQANRHQRHDFYHNVARIGLQVARALRYAHSQGTLHRDIKPGNLLLDAEGVVWVADFGLAKLVEHENVTQSGDVVGTLRYMAPEQFESRGDARSDIYSLGLTLYELLAGRPAFEDRQRGSLIRRITDGSIEPLGRIRPDLPRDFETIITKSIASDPRHRYQMADDMAEDLQCFLEDRPISARRVTQAERLWRWCRRNKLVATLAGAALSLLLLVAVVTTNGYFVTRRANRDMNTALTRETEQREKAEATLETSLQALDRVYQRFAPDRTAPIASLSVSSDEDESEVEVPAQPVLTRETADLLEDILAFYDKFAEQGTTSERLKVETARANRRVGDIQRRLGQFDKAIGAYHRAAEMYAELAKADPDKSVFLSELASIHNALGTVQFAASQFESSRQSHSHALELLESSTSKSADVRFELAHTYYYLARRPGPGGGGGPPPGRRSPGGDQRSGQRGPPRDRDRPGTLSRTDTGQPAGDRRGGPPRLPFGRRRPGSEYMEKAIQLLCGLREESPRIPEYRHLLALCYRSERYSKPEYLGQSITILEELHNEYPNVADYRHDLVETYIRRVPADHEQSEAALAKIADRLQAALRHAEQLSSENPNIPDYVRSHARVHTESARLSERTIALLAETEQSDSMGNISTLDELIREAISQYDTETSSQLIGEAIQQFDTAISHFDTAIKMQSRLVSQYPLVPAYRVELVRLQIRKGRLLRDFDRLDEAEAAVLAGIKQIAFPSSGEVQPFFTFGLSQEAYRTLSHIYRRMGKMDEAAEAEAQSLAFREQLFAKFRERFRRRDGEPNEPRPSSGN